MAAWYSDIFLPYFTGERVSFCSSGNSQLAADYVVISVNQEQRQKPGPGLVAYFQVREPSYTASVKGAGWAWIYPAPHMMYEVRGKSQIEGRAWLSGYSTIDKPCLGAILPVTLYIRVLGDLPPTETFDVRLVAPDGRFIGEWQGAGRVDDWMPGAVVEWHGTLSLPGDLPTGDYRLDVGLGSVETGQHLTRFAWNEAEQGWLRVIESEDCQ